MASSTISFYRVTNDKVVDENAIKTIVGGAIDLDRIKKEAAEIYRKKKLKSITGTLIRFEKNDKNGCILNEHYVYYDGLKFRKKFDLYWDVKELAEFLGGSRYEPVMNLREM